MSKATTKNFKQRSLGMKILNSTEIKGALSLSGAMTAGAKINDSRITTGNQQLINASSDIIYAGNPQTKLQLESSSTPSVNVGGASYTLYHTGNKPSASDIGALASEANAVSASKLQTARTIKAIGDATGSTSFDGSADKTIALTLENSGVTSGSYGPTANSTASFSGTFTIPQITVDAKGRVTSASTRTITMPANPNSDTKVTNTLAATTKAYITGTTSASTNTGTQVFDTGVYLDTTAGTLTATTFKGALSGNATTATTATKATQDSAGQQINTTYIKGLSVSGKTITYTKGDGTTGTITTQDTNTTYSVGTASALGLTKLYTGTGTATDGTMTQAAISTALTSHTHKYAGSSSAGGAANSAVKLATTRKITLNGVVTGSTSFDGSGDVTITTSANDITTINKSLKVTTDWMDTGIAGTNLSDGTYAVQVYVHDATTRFNEYYSGTMSWYSGTISSSVHGGGSNYLRGTNIQSCEILLHNAGQSSTLTDNTHIFLRTLRVLGANLKLQIASATAFSSKINVIFRFKKLI